MECKGLSTKLIVRLDTVELKNLIPLQYELSPQKCHKPKVLSLGKSGSGLGVDPTHKTCNPFDALRVSLVYSISRRQMRPHFNASFQLSKQGTSHRYLSFLAPRQKEDNTSSGNQ
ncbi:hypothetical protein CEXT_83131 [Caerostris extrusa]|uniref:Uncharacterized protein n=1 Tax=Caerostris extrusa TaxID=172846 RepID=A0AAV4SFQ1_CAEEX|nr:hypothetical protein CEXT_83131 [Caerostris extrusa]